MLLPLPDPSTTASAVFLARLLATGAATGALALVGGALAGYTLERHARRARRAHRMDRIAAQPTLALARTQARPVQHWSTPYCPRCVAHHRQRLPHLPLPDRGVPGLACEAHRVSPALASLVSDLGVAPSAEREEAIARAEREEPSAPPPDALSRAGWERVYAKLRLDDDDIRASCN